MVNSKNHKTLNKNNSNDDKSNNKTKLVQKIIHSHWFYILIIVVFLSLTLNPYFSTDKTCHSGDCRVSHLTPYIIIKNSISDFNQIPLWNSQIMSGEPFFNMGIPVFYPIVLIMSLFMSAVGVMNFTIILHMFLGGISMYFLSYYLIKQKPMALVSSFIYLLSYLLVIRSIVYWVIGASITPLVILFILKSFDTKDTKKQVLFSIIAGFLMSLMFLGGATNHIFYLGFILAYLFTYQLIKGRKNIIITIKKLFIIGLIFSLVFIGFSAIKLLPSNQWISYTNRAGSLPWEEVYNVGHISLDNAFNLFVKGAKTYGTDAYQIGLIGLFLLIFSFYYYQKRKSSFILFSYLAIIITTILASGGFFIFWKYIPTFGKLRGIVRIMYIYVIFASLLGAYGLYGFLIWMKNRFKLSGKKLKYLVWLVVFLLILDAHFFANRDTIDFNFIPKSRFENKNVLLENNEIMNYISQDDNLFRIHSYEINGIDNSDISTLVVPMKQEMIYGAYSPIWYPPYFYYYLGASIQSPSKLWGLLNVKYLTSSKEINISGFNFIKQFEEYDRAVPDHSDGPFLYENSNFIPRIANYKNVILVVGDENSVEQATYGMMISNDFNSNQTLLVLGDKQYIDQYSITELKKFSGIILVSGSITENSGYLLSRLKKENISVVPDLLGGEKQLTGKSLTNFFSKIQQINYDDVDLILYSPNKRIIDVKDKDGWIFMSEQYTMYGEGWHAYLDNNEVPIYRVDGVLSAVYLDNSEYKELVLEYFPSSLKKGLTISIITLLGVLGFFWYYLFEKYIIKK